MMDHDKVPIGTVQRILGHENRVTTEIYLHSIGDGERAAVERLEKVKGLSNFLTQTLTQKAFKTQKSFQLVFYAHPAVL
ncbi:hypothetical protein [uncultured Desulfobacter sp.]|uniref:hypothetical protein n=1 Tax=uncultured Desulfobacter sp. TaxID=240139 RepID=UPI0029C723D5|nr:hypothetical protein [uncultured Desulfobacter sp.]